MAETSWPFDPDDTTEVQYSQIFRRLVSSGVWGTPSDTELKVFADSSGMKVKLPAGFAFVRGHMYWNSAELELDISTADSSARVDSVVLTLDPSANEIVAEVLPGTPGSSTPPALTLDDAGIYQVRLANVAVGASVSTISSGDVTDVRSFAGQDFGLWTTANRPASPRLGQPGYNTSLSRPEYWDGSTWKSFIITSVTASMISDQGNITAGNSLKVGGRSIWVQATDPGGADGDLWFW